MRPIDLPPAERRRLLERAADRCFFLDLDDLGARLCRAAMPYGLAKLQWLQEELGAPADARWISTPDSTVTRNLGRWRSGLGYGGAVEWSGDFVPLELRPNFCGMIVAGLDHAPPPAELAQRTAQVAREAFELDGVPVVWDADQSNHFLTLYRVSEPAVAGGHPFAAILHSSGAELRGPTRHGPGLYLNRGPGGLEELAESLPTPFGVARFLRGEAAERYFRFCDFVADFVLRRRAAYARRLFGENVAVLFNRLHQGLQGRGRMLLGCYHAPAGEVPWVPVTLQPELPARLVAPAAIYSEAVLRREGLWERARAAGCAERLLRADLLPHGGGYCFPGVEPATAVVEDRGPDQPRRFRVGDRPEWFEDVRDLPFAYRGEEVLRRLEELGAGRVVATLEPVQRLAP